MLFPSTEITEPRSDSSLWSLSNGLSSSTNSEPSELPHLSVLRSFVLDIINYNPFDDLENV